MSYPKCPHCGYQYDDEDIYAGSSDFPVTEDGDGEENIVECPSCKESTWVRILLTPRWEFFDVETYETLEYKEGK